MNIVNALSAIGQLLSQREADEGSDMVRFLLTSTPEIASFYWQADSSEKLMGGLTEYFPNPELTSLLLKHLFEDSPVLSLWPVLHKANFERSYPQNHDGPSSTTHAILLAVVCLLSLQSLPESSNDVCLTFGLRIYYC